MLNVSIITPTYNSSLFIRETIDSILNQTYTNWELLITDDCSTDSTWNILNEYSQKDQRIKIFKLERNSGAGVARNNSIAHATGEFIAFCDSDDCWKPEKLQIQLDYMDKHNCPFVFSGCDIVNENNEIIGLIKAKPKINYKILLRNNYIPCLTAIYNQSVIGKIYMPEVRKRQDWAYWLKILKVTSYAFGIEESLAIYRKRNDSLSSNKLNLLKHNWNIYRNIENFSFIKSIYLINQFLFFYFLYKKFKI